MKAGVTIWLEPDVRGTWFVYDGDLEANCRKAAEMGFHGVELLVRSAKDLSRQRLGQALTANGLELAAVSSGGGLLHRGLTFSNPDAAVRRAARAFAVELIDFAGELRAPVIFGMLKGGVAEGVARPTALDWIREGLNEAGRAAARHGVNVLIEPQNRYEINLINRLDEGIELIRSLEIDNARLLADLFHMNIEEQSICGALRQAADFLGHVHFADSNRRPPGCGHIDFAAVGRTLRDIGYRGYTVLECGAYPTPDDAAESMMRCFRRHIRPEQ